MFCREPIWVHEPIIVVEHEGERQTSLAREPIFQSGRGGYCFMLAAAPAGGQSNA